jgi:hypothetical protein
MIGRGFLGGLALASAGQETSVLAPGLAPDDPSLRAVKLAVRRPRSEDRTGGEAGLA